MKKTALLIATALLTAALTACSGSNGSGGGSTTNTVQQEAAASDTTVDKEDQNASQASTDEGGIEVDKGLMNVEITIPAEAAESYGFKFESQEDADACMMTAVSPL